jgi:hypothetical protein
MIYCVCDLKECGKKCEPIIELQGYYPAPRGWRFHFCSHDCFVAWMRWALEHEQRRAFAYYKKEPADVQTK